MACNAPAHLNKSNHGHMLFVGGIPYDMKSEEFERETAHWKGACDKYYGGVTKGWGSVSFDTITNRNLFLNDKRKHVLGKKIVDVKPYGKPKEETKPGSGLGLGSMNLTSTISSISSNAIINKPVPMNIAPEPVPLPPIPTPVTKAEPPITVLEQALANCQTGAILRYISPNFGLLRTPKHGNGVFHADAVYLCSQHNLACKTLNCPDYTEFTTTSGTKKRGSIFASLPVGTQVNFLGRPIHRASFPDIEFKFQATLVWPQLSKKPSSVAKPQDSILDEQLRKFVLLEQRFIEDHDSNLYLSKKLQIANIVDADDQISLDDDSDFDDDLNLGELDTVLDQMSAIKNFLRNIGFSNELPLLGLANRLMAIKDEDKAIEAIMQCLEESRIHTDESKRASIIANYRTLQHTLRRGKSTGIIGSPPLTQNNMHSMKFASLNSQSSTNLMSNANCSGFPGDVWQENYTPSVISRPPPGLSGYTLASNSLSTPPVAFDDELIEEKFEAHFYKKTRASEFSWIEKDETVKKQCKIVTELWKDVGYTISKLAMEYEIYNDLPASDNPRNVLANKWSEKLRGKNGNNRVLMYNEKIAAVSMDFFESKAHYKCIAGRNLDPHLELRTYFEMFTKGHSLNGQQHHPHAKHLKKALRSLKMDKNLIQLAYEAFNDSCDPSRTSMAEKLPGWRTTFRKLIEKHENYQGIIPDQACDHVFIYLDTRNFTNKPILSESDDEHAVEPYTGEDSPRYAEQSNSDSKDDFDRNSMISDSISVTSSINNGIGGTRDSRSSSLDPASKQVGHKKLPVKRNIAKEARSHSLSSSSNKDPIPDIPDNFFDGEHFVSVSLKSCGNTFKTCPSNDNTTAIAVAKLVDAGGDYHPYQHFIKWLKDNYKVIQKEGHPIENTALYIRTVVDAWIKAEKPVSELKEEFRKGFGEPVVLYCDWAKCVERTMESPVTASVDSVIKTTFQYCWEALTLSKTMSTEANNQFLQLFRNVSYKTDEGFYHVRGIIIHPFSEDFGLIQTKFGKVLYERNIAYTMKPDGSSGSSANGSNWRRCKNSSLVFNKHVMVKLHFRVGKFKVKKNAVKYLYATKVWLSFPSTTLSEPSSGVCILGRDGYWKEVHVEFEKIVRANSSIRFHHEPSECSSVIDYRQAYSTALKYRHKLLLLTHGIRNMDDLSTADKSFDQLIAYVENGPHLLDPIHRDEVISTIKQLSIRNVNFFDIRKTCLLHTLISTIECFETDIELMLFAHMRSNNKADSKAFVTPNVCDIVPFLMDFLNGNDSVFNDQLEEQRKFFQKEKKGSLSQLENIISIINRLYNVETVPPLSVLLPPPEDVLAKTQIRQTRQAALMREQQENDNSGDNEADFESENGITKVDQREIETVVSSGAQSLKLNDYSSKDNVQIISNGSISKTSRKLEEPVTSTSMSSNTVDTNLPPAHSNIISNAKQKIDTFDIKAINLEESEQFRQLGERIKELEAWKEQRVKEDNAFKDTINLTFTKVLDKLVELDQNFQVLKVQQGAIQNATVTTTHRLRNGQKSFIKITTADNPEIHEFPSDEEGNLSVASVNAVYQGINALKYKSLETGTIRLCSKSGEIFEPPEDGWGNRIYFANITGSHIGTGSSTMPGSNTLGLAAAQVAVQAQTQQTPTFRGQAPFSHYGHGLQYPVSVASLRAAATLQPQGGLTNNTNSNSYFGPLINGTSYKLDS